MAMPYTRPYRRFYLTPPAVPTFVISVLLAIVAVLAVYGHFTLLRGVSAFAILLIAYVVLLLCNLLHGVLGWAGKHRPGRSTADLQQQADVGAGKRAVVQRHHVEIDDIE